MQEYHQRYTVEGHMDRMFADFAFVVREGRSN